MRSSRIRSPALMREMADAVVSRCIDHIASAGRQPSCGDVDAAELCRAMREAAPEHGAALEPILDALFRDCVPRSFTTIGPGYLAYIPGGGLFPAALADFIADTTNRFTGIWQAAPALVQLEANALDWIRDWMGFPPGGARPVHDRRIDGDLQRDRLRARTPSRRRHPPRRALHLGPGAPLGAQGREARRRHARPRPRRSRPTRATASRSTRSPPRSRLDRAAGLTPFAVVSSAGTTNTGAVDPLEAIADVCAREQLWHHVDGAYGGFFFLCDELREGVLAGLSRADSLTLDPHKGMFLPYGTGALLVRDGAALRAAHEATAPYLPAMPHPEDFYDPSQHGPELSRRFPGLRVWLSVKLFGAAAFRAAIAEKRALAVEAARRVAALPGIVIDAEPDLSLFAFHLTWPGATREEEDAATRELMTRTTARGRVMVTGASAHGRYLGRACVLSFRTHQAEIDQFVEDLAAASAEIVAERAV